MRKTPIYKTDKLYFVKVEKYYENKKKEIINKIDPEKNYKYKFYADHSDNNIIEIYDNNKLILKAEYDLAGIYNLYNSVWYWGWNLDLVNRKLVERSKIVKKFASDIKKNYDKFDPVEAEELYFRSNSGNFYTSKKNIVKLVKLILYLTKSIWFIPVCYGKDDTIVSCDNIKGIDSSIKRLEYLLIKKIIQVG